jgi:hypothetical protein
VQTVPLWSPGLAGQKRRGEEGGVSTERSGDDVAADGRLGTPWRARRRAAGERSRLGEEKRRRVEGEGKQEVGGCGLHSGGRGSCTGGRTGGAGKQSRACARGRRREGRVSGGPICENQELQGPQGKERFPTDLEVF